MMETIDTIIQWHKETFPDTTLEEQEKKFILERIEFRKECRTINGKIINELADMYIVACGIARFSLSELVLYFDEIKEELRCYGISYENFDKAIDEKMAINRKRQWQYANGEYRHI